MGLRHPANPFPYFTKGPILCQPLIDICYNGSRQCEQRHRCNT